jgi:hypothetical protein
MRQRVILRSVILVGLGALLVTLSPGCKDPDSEMFIQGVLAPSEGDCSYTFSSDAKILVQGTMDIAIKADDYVGVVLVGNQLVRRGNAVEQVRTETSRVVLKTAEVSIENAAGSVVKSYSVPISGFANPGTGDTPGFGGASVVLLDANTARSIGGDLGVHRITSRVRVFGTTIGGSDVQSSEYPFQIEVCAGCLISYSPANDDPTIEGPDCALRTESTATTALCNAGQDGPVPCELVCALNPALCPAEP